MKKQYMYFIFTLVLVLSSFIPVSNGFTLKETPHLLESEKYIPKKTQTINKTKISYHVGKESIEETENYNKISKYVSEKIQKVGLDTPIAVTVGISYKYNLQNFLSNLSLVEKEIAKITSAYTFDTNLTGQQIQLLAQNKEVLWISLSSEIVTIDESINSMKDEDSIIVPFLNASTEMTGTKKARKDFGVTGNRDGSMSAPAVAGILALMNDASNGSLIYTIYTEDFGKSGFDPVYGNGEILAYDSIKEAKGAFSGSFDDFRDHLIGQTSIDEGFIHTYTINVYHTDTNLYFATTLLMLDEDGDDFDLYVWGPGKDPHTDAPDYSSIGTDPQEVISFKPTSTGNYTVGIYAYSGGGQYSVDFIGQIRPEG
ncbi:exported hypothetical protein [[Clostridium] ultunense Esp]|uniref:S8 family serine peptidase n=1 Tax=Thermicanus aegyptius TaxID=94009 RepID=UPI0002B70DCF|nr:S8 family serine peptidase [Thermicanus aegyptius]CCQ95362.1 exported hypothetical protein [[Clostridium] ultunense Esp]